VVHNAHLHTLAPQVEVANSVVWSVEVLVVGEKKRSFFPTTTEPAETEASSCRVQAESTASSSQQADELALSQPPAATRRPPHALVTASGGSQQVPRPAPPPPHDSQANGAGDGTPGTARPGGGRGGATAGGWRRVRVGRASCFVCACRQRLNLRAQQSQGLAACTEYAGGRLT
jgi:hypothetical protein